MIFSDSKPCLLKRWQIMSCAFFVLLSVSVSNSVIAQNNSLNWLEINESGDEIHRQIPVSETQRNTDKRQIIQHFYDSLGYFEHQLLVENDSLALVKSGPRYSYQTELNVDTTLQNIISGIDLWRQNFSSGLYDAGIIEEGFETLRALFLTQGFPAVKLQIQEPILDVQQNSTTLFVQIETGERLTREALVFSGLETTSELYARRLTSLRINDVLNRRNLIAARRNLQQSGLFASVSEPAVIRLNDSLRVLLQVREQNPNQFDLVLGYVPNSSGNNEIVGEGELNLKEVFGEGVYLDLAFSRMQQDRNSLRIASGKKWWFGLPLSLNGSFDIYQRDSTFQSRDISVGVGYALSSTTTVEGFLAFEDRTRGIATEIENQNDTEALLSGVSLLLDTRDDVIVPLSGLNFTLTAEVGRLQNLNLPDSSSFNQREQRQRLRIKSRYYWNPFGRHILSPRINGGVVLAENYQLGDMFRFGGTQSLRGYREEQFEASTYVWGDVEYRFLLDRSTYLFTFGAAGWYENKILKSDDYVTSFGLGLAYNTPIGLVSFTYAKAPEDPFNNAKIHFGIRGRL
jgi:outer membrane protein insertion porin family